MSCLVCKRIEQIKRGTNPYFVKELATGYVVLGDHQYCEGYTLFLAKEHKTELRQLDKKVKILFYLVQFFFQIIIIDFIKFIKL